MWFLNKKTGLEWLVEDKELQKRLENDNDYEVVTKEEQPKKKATPPKKEE